MAGLGRTVRGWRAASVLLLVGALGLTAGCQPGGGPSPTATDSGTAPSAGATIGGTTAGAGQGIVVLDRGVLAVRGRSLPVTCDGKPPVTRDVPALLPSTSMVWVSPGTRLHVAEGGTITMCPGTAYTPARAQVPAGRAVYRYRVWVENDGLWPVVAATATSTIQVLAGGSFVPQPSVDDSPAVPPALGQIYPGEVGTFEVLLAVPTDGRDYVVQGEPGNGSGFRILDGVRQGPPTQVDLPAPTPVVTPRILPTAPAGLSPDPGGFVLGPTAQLPHECSGVPPTSTTTIEKPSAEGKARTLDPGTTLELTDRFRITLCPGEAYEPTPAVYPTGAVTYRKYTAFVTQLELGLDLPLANYLPAIMDSGGHPPALGGRVVDPTEIAYPSRQKLTAGQTAKFVFALAIPTSGGPYFVKAGPSLLSAFRLQ